MENTSFTCIIYLLPVDISICHIANVVLSRQHLTEFIVLDIEPVDMQVVNTSATAKRFIHLKAGKTAKMHPITPTPMNDTTPKFGRPENDPGAGRLVDVEIARLSDFAKNDNRMVVRSHLGRTLRVGDWCFGYDLKSLNLSGFDDDTAIQEKVCLNHTTPPD